MSSKSAEPSDFSPRKWSITRRLAFLYTLSAIITLTTVALLFDWSLRDGISREENEFLDDRLRSYRSILEKLPDPLAVVRTDIEWEGAYVTYPEYYARIINESGRVLTETPGMTRVLPASLFPVPEKPGTFSGGDILWKSGNKRYYLLKSAAALYTKGAQERRVIQIGLDTTSAQAAIADKEQLIVVFFFLGVLVATGVGLMVARKALSPLKEITDVAELITIARISMRTDPQSWPEELQSLVLAFNGMLDRLEESFHRLSQLSSNLAHELRTPVNNLILEAEVILSHERGADDYRTTIESAMEEYQRLSRIIDSLLFLARAENPAARMTMIPFDALVEAGKVCSFFEALSEEHGATVTCRGEGQIFGDPLMFSRAISNLLANSLYYSNPGVKIDIAITIDADGFVDVTVTDNGCGIPSYELPKIFDRFYRGDEMRAAHPEGSGLGLPIVQTIMNLHGGTVRIASTLGAGTTVTLTFPPLVTLPSAI